MRMRSVAIRLRIRLVREGKSVDVVALINSGYETREPEVLLPVAIATMPTNNVCSHTQFSLNKHLILYTV
jgi:hypothetical protein